jgi:hypothetical protein
MGGASAPARPALTTELKPIPKAAVKAAGPAQQAQADADALVTRMANALSQALSGASVELSGVTYDAKKGELRGAAKVRGKASLGGKDWAVEVDCQVSGKKS